MSSVFSVWNPKGEKKNGGEGWKKRYQLLNLVSQRVEELEAIVKLQCQESLVCTYFKQSLSSCTWQILPVHLSRHEETAGTPIPPLQNAQSSSIFESQTYKVNPNFQDRGKGQRPNLCTWAPREGTHDPIPALSPFLLPDPAVPGTGGTVRP